MKKLIASLLIAATFQASAAGFVDGIVVANGATLSGQTSITGSADVPQLLLRANSSQTQAIAKISNSTGLTDYFRINADGTIIFSSSVTAPTFIGALTGNASTVTNGVYTTDTGTVTNTMLAGSIANNKLSNSSITINGNTVSLGGSTTVSASTTNPLTIGDGLQLNSGTTFDGGTAKTLSANYNATNLKITSSALNTIQDIATTSSPQFAKLTIAGTSDTNQLTVKANASQSTDIFKVTDAGGSTAYVATSQLGTTTFNPGIKSNSIDAIGISDTQSLAHGFAISGTAGIGTLSGNTITAGSLNSDYLSSKTANTALQIGAGLSGADTGALTLYTNGTGKITLQNGANTSASAIELNPLAGGVTITPATNKDVTITTSGTGKTSVVDLTASGTITGNLTGTATNATNIAVTNVTTDATMYPLFSSATSGNTGAKLSSTRLTFNPLSGLLSSTGIINSDTWMQSDVFRQSGNTTALSFNNTGSNSTANAIGITSTSGGITLTPAANKDITLTTSGTGKTSVVDLTATGTINGVNQNLTGSENFPYADGDKILLLGTTTAAKIIHSPGFEVGFYSGSTTAPSIGKYAWYTVNGSSAFASVMALSNTGLLTVGGGINLPTLTASQIVGTDGSKNLTSIATTGSGSVALATSPVLTTPNIGAATGTSLATTGNITINSGKQVVNAIASANLTGQTSTVASIAAFTPTSTTTFDISGYIRCTAYTSGTIQLQVTYTDETNTPQTNVIPLVNTSGTPVTGANTGGFWSAMPRTIRANTSTAITVKTVGTFSATYDVGAYIHQAA